MLKNMWYETITPHEHSESEGSHCFTEDHQVNLQNSVDVKCRTMNGFPGAYCIVTRKPEEIFLLYGCIAPDKNATGAAIAKLDAITLEVKWKVPLVNSKATKEWNYPGTIGVHKNGFIYVVYGYRLSKIDPDTGQIIKTVKLPTYQLKKDVAYNGFIIMGDGYIVTKSVHRKIGCLEDGFRAYLKCGPSDVPSSLAVICPETMEVVSEVSCDEMIGSRICGGLSNDTEYIYMAGLSKLHRYIYKNHQLVYDDAWGPITYLREHQTNGSAPAVVGDYIILNTNGIPAFSPMDVVAISQANSKQQFRYTPFPNSNFSFNPCKVTVDPENNIIYVMDGLAGKLAALKFDGENGFKLLWQVKQSSFSFMNLIGSESNRILISNEVIIPKFLKILRRIIFPYFKPILYLFKYERVIWRNAKTGEKIKTSQKLARGGFTSTPGYSLKYYVPTTFKGMFFELQLITITQPSIE